MQPYIRAGILEHFRSTSESFGVDPESLLREAHVSLEVTRLPGIFLPYHNYRRLLDCAARATGAPHFGLAMMRSGSAESLGTAGIIMTQADTVWSAWAALARIYRIHDTYGAVAVSHEPGQLACISYRIPRNDLPGTRQVYDAAAGLATNIMKQFCGSSFRALGYAFPYPEPDDLSCYAVLQSENLEFDTDALRIRFDPALLSQPLPGGSDELRIMLDHYFANREGAGQPSTGHRVEELIRRLLPSGECTLALVADMLDLTPRTLQAHLEQEGGNFRQLLEKVRREIATYHLHRGDMPLTHLAQVLGYSEQSAFSRSFRQWYGIPPRQWASINRGVP